MRSQLLGRAQTKNQKWWETGGRGAHLTRTRLPTEMSQSACRWWLASPAPLVYGAVLDLSHFASAQRFCEAGRGVAVARRLKSGPVPPHAPPSPEHQNAVFTSMSLAHPSLQVAPAGNQEEGAFGTGVVGGGGNPPGATSSEPCGRWIGRRHQGR
jgi:hypothetical protein